MKLKPWQGFIISLLFGLIGLFFLIRTTGKISFVGLNYSWLIVALGITVIWWIADTMSLKIILDTIGHKLKLFQLVKIMLSSFFFGAITPFNSGFLPAELVLLKGANVSLDLSFPAVMAKMILNGLLRGLLSIVLGLSLKNYLGSVLGNIIIIILFIYGLASIFGYFILFSKNKYSTIIRESICKLLDFLGSKFRFLNRIASSVSNSLRNGPKNIEPLFKNYHWLPKTLFWSLLFWASQFSLPYFLLRTIGANDISFVNVFLAQSSFYLLQPYLPTPGGSGIAEVGYNFLTKSFINIQSPVYIFLWRFLSFYLPMIIGALFVIPQSKEVIEAIRKGKN